MQSNIQYSDPDDFVDPLSDYEPEIYPSAIEEALAEDKISSMRTTPYPEVSPDLPVRNAIHALFGLQVASLLVVEDGKLVGVFTERDVLERVAESIDKVGSEPVRNYMTTDPVVLRPDALLAAGLSAIAMGGYRHVPVVDDEHHPVGIVSPRRLFSYLEAKFDS